MNDNDLINMHDDGIGIDPTVVEEIDSLDNTSGNPKLPRKNQKKEVKPSDILKKVLFTVVILALMAGVSFGLYYYLSLGRTSSKAVKLNNYEIYVGDTLPLNIFEYGEFGSIDIAKCTLNILDVDINKVGTYDYSVVCGEAKYQAKVIVTEKKIFNLATKMNYQTSNQDILPEKFISSKENDYTYSLVDGTKTYGKGMNLVEIKAINNSNQELIINGLMYIVDILPERILSCEKDMEVTNDYNLSITDSFALNNENKNMNLSTRSYKYKYNDEKTYEKMKKNISSGLIKINDNEGYALIDNNNYTIEVVKTLNENELSSEIGEKHWEISNYYRKTLEYTCNIETIEK